MSVPCQGSKSRLFHFFPKLLFPARSTMAESEQNCLRCHESTDADCSVAGPASAVLLWLWQREGGAVDIVDDATIAQRFRALGSLD